LEFKLQFVPRIRWQRSGKLVLAAGRRKLPVKAPGLWASGFGLLCAASFTLFRLSRFPR